MAQKKINHALHIKRHTQGSSNEISFSVLDAAKEARDAEERARKGEGSSAGRVPLFTLGKGRKPRSTPEKGSHIVVSDKVSSQRGSAISSAASATVKDRSAFRFVPALVGVCVIVALFLTIGQSFLQMRSYQDDLRGGLSQQVARITDVDDTLIPFDTLVRSQYDDEHFSQTPAAEDGSLLDGLTEQYRQVVADIAPAQSEMQQSIASIEQLQPSLADNDDKEAAAQAVIAARSRLNMLEIGIAIVDESLMATEAFEESHEGWGYLLDADAAVRNATAYLEAMSEESVRSSMEQSQQAVDCLENAVDCFAQAQDAYPGLDIQGYIDYADKRLSAQKAALSSDQAYLDRNKEALEEENERYNALEAEAAALAQDLTEDPQVIVAEKYRVAIEKNKESYEAERQKAGNADTFLRDYLGKGE